MHPWLKQPELIEALSGLDLLYCPYWFSEEMRETTLLSFPSKLVTYLASGRPVVFHGRADASPARFLIEGAAGFFCFRQGVEAIRRTLTRSLTQPDLYAQTARNGNDLVTQHLSFEALSAGFATFMAGAEAVAQLEARRA